MKQENKTRVIAAAVVIVGLILLALATSADAHKWHDDHAHTNDNDTSGCMCVSGGVSDSDLSKGLSLAMASGGHELDFSTQDWQLSVTYALQVNEDDEGAGSFKVGKRWDKFADVLMHVTYTPEQGQDYGDWVIVGGTIRF
ncbi:MAG: hypothetical protein ACR2PH_15670 [Desulfobulbia bacterium]